MTTKAVLYGLFISGLIAGMATAADPDTIELFGQVYKVQRFDYFDEVRYPDPIDPNYEVGLIEVEGAHYLGNNRLLMTTDEMDAFLSYKNHIVEVQLDTDASGTITGLSYVGLRVLNDPDDPNLGGFDLDPGGVTINTSADPNDLAYGGDLLFSDTEIDVIRGYLAEPNDIYNHAENLLGTWDCKPQNSDPEDLEYVPDPNDPNRGELFTVYQGDNYESVEIFKADGTWIRRFFIGKTYASDPTRGDPKGIVYLPDESTFPTMFHGLGGVVLIALDDVGPGLEAYKIDAADANQISHEPLEDPNGDPLLDPGNDYAMQLESLAADPATGRLFLVQQGDWSGLSLYDSMYMWVLSPIRGLDLSINKTDYGTVAISPDPNDANAPAYPAGTIVTLTAEPNETRSFNKWVVYDPNFPGDANYATEDTNTVISVVLNTDMQVEAHFKCGSGVELALPLLLVTAAWTASLIRRRR